MSFNASPANDATPILTVMMFATAQYWCSIACVLMLSLIRWAKWCAPEHRLRALTPQILRRHNALQGPLYSSVNRQWHGQSTLGLRRLCHGHSYRWRFEKININDHQWHGLRCSFVAAMAVVKVFSYKRRLPTWVRGSLYESILRFLLASSNSAARVCTVCSMLSLCCWLWYSANNCGRFHRWWRSLRIWRGICKTFLSAVA